MIQSKNKMWKTVFFSFLLIGIISCEKTFTGKEIVAQSIEAHGFSTQLDQLFYKKKTQLFNADGSLEKTLLQKHAVEWNPFAYTIEQNTPKGNQISHFQNSTYFLSTAGEEDHSSEGSAKAKEAIRTAYYVFWQPAKLNDSNAVMKYLGQRKIQGEKLAQAVQVSYPGSDSSDEWIFYFDPKTHLNIGYSVRHNERWSLIVNDSFHLDHQPILVNKRRSFFVDSLKNTTTLRAAYTYTLQP